MPLSIKTHKRADVVLVLFPHSDLRSAKLRPALVLQADGLNTGLPQLVVAMISSKTRRANHRSRILVSLETVEGKRSGLLGDSVIMTDNIATIALSAIPRRIGSLPNMNNVDAGFAAHFGNIAESQWVKATT